VISVVEVWVLVVWKIPWECAVAAAAALVMVVVEKVRFR